MLEMEGGMDSTVPHETIPEAMPSQMTPRSLYANLKDSLLAVKSKQRLNTSFRHWRSTQKSTRTQQTLIDFECQAEPISDHNEFKPQRQFDAWVMAAPPDDVPALRFIIRVRIGRHDPITKLDQNRRDVRDSFRGG